MRLAAGLVWAVALTLSGIGSAHADKRVALVIGNSGYRDVAPLDNPANDAKLIADTLRGLGFTVVGGGAQVDLDKTAMDRAVQNFGAQLAGADVGLFYYAGHAMQVREANYLVPVDANPTKEADVDFQMLDTDAVLRQMESAGTRLNIVILDACRNNPFLAAAPGGRVRSASRGLARMQAPEGTLISFATQPGSVAQDGTDGHSPYSRALAQTLRAPGLGIFETFNQVGLEVKRATGGAQQPWVSSSPIEGAFYFVPSVKAGDVALADPLVAVPATPSADPRQGAKVAFDDGPVRQLAAREGIPLPPALSVVDPGPASQHADLLGAWGGDRWNGSARSIILVIEDVDEKGAATVVYAYGAPTNMSPTQNAASWRTVSAMLTGDSIKFTMGTSSYTFRLVGEQLRGHLEAPNVNATVTLQRITSTGQVASIASTDQSGISAAAGSSSTSPPQGRARGELSGSPAVLAQADGLFTEQDMQRVTTIAARDKLQAMPQFMIDRPDPAVPAPLRKLVGIWASDVGFNGGKGRHAMIIVTDVAAPDQVTGFYVWGAPTPNGGQFPAGFDAFHGKGSGAQLTFAADKGDKGYSITLTASGDGFAMEQKTKTGQQLKVALKPVWRLLAAEQSAQAHPKGAPLPSDASDVHRFDGLWTTSVACDKKGDVLAWSHEFVGQLENGSFHGEWGVEGQPGFNKFDGTVKGNGVLQLTQIGISDGKPTAIAKSGVKGTFGYAGRLEGSQGTALRLEGRSCHLSLVKQ